MNYGPNVNTSINAMFLSHVSLSVYIFGTTCVIGSLTCFLQSSFQLNATDKRTHTLSINFLESLFISSFYDQALSQTHIRYIDMTSEQSSGDWLVGWTDDLKLSIETHMSAKREEKENGDYK